MNKRIMIMLSFLLLFITFLSSCSIENNYYVPQNVNVYLEESIEYEIISANPVTIKKGQDAEFKIHIKDGYEFDCSSDGEYLIDNSTFIVKNVQYSRNVSFNARAIGNYIVTIINDEKLGDYTISPLKKGYNKGDKVTISTNEKNGDFMCYTYQNPYRNDDYYEATGMPLSFNKEYTFTIDGDITICTNYFDNTLLKMEYNANGGMTIDNKELLLVDHKLSKPHLNPVTLLGTYYLFKDGYTLESYNTRADGSGERIGIGSKVDVKNAVNGKITLFAQWKKWDSELDFETIDIDENTAAISKYIGDNKSEVVIPNIINNKKITKINKNAFDNLNLENIILNLDLQSIEENAVNNCNNLKSLLMFSNIIDIKENSIISSSLKKVLINSTVYADNSTLNERDLSCQLDQISSMENDKVIFVGQSTLRYNHDFSLFKSHYPNKDFYVYGMQAGAQFALPLDILTNYLSENDTVVISLLETTIKRKNIGSTTFVYLKYNFDLLQSINYQDYNDIFFPSYNKFVIEMARGLNNKVFNSEKGVKLDDYGSFSWGPSTDDVNNVDPSYVPNFSKYQNESDLQFIDEIMDKFMISQENKYITWSTYNKNSVSDESIFLNFEEFVKDTLPTMNYFDSILENIYPGNYFRANDSIHLSKIGGNARVQRWVEQLPL